MLATMLLSVSAMAETITVHLPFSATGSYQKIIKMILNDMSTNKGYQFDIKVTGNPLLSKNAFKSANGPFVLGWDLVLNTSKKAKDYMAPPTEKNFIGMTHINNQFLCASPKLPVSEFFNKSKVYKIGTGIEDSRLKYLRSFFNHVGVKHKLISYKDSGASSDALIAGEVDFVFNSKGTNLQKKGKAVCFFNSGFSTIADIKNIASAYPTLKEPYYIESSYLQATNFKKGQLEKFISDFRDSQNNAELVKYLKGRSAGLANKVAYKDQLSALKNEDAKLK